MKLDKSPREVRLFYRHVNQGERFQVAGMEAQRKDYRATIPAAYTDSPYPLQYYFEIRHDSKNATLYPGFATDLTNQPYYVVRPVARV